MREEDSGRTFRSRAHSPSDAIPRACPRAHLATSSARRATREGDSSSVAVRGDRAADAPERDHQREHPDVGELREVCVLEEAVREGQHPGGAEPERERLELDAPSELVHSPEEAQVGEQGQCRRNEWRQGDERLDPCDVCGHHIYPAAGTIFHKSSTSLRVWFLAIYLMSSTKTGVPAKWLDRESGVTYKAAWRIFKQV